MICVRTNLNYSLLALYRQFVGSLEIITDFNVVESNSEVPGDISGCSGFYLSIVRGKESKQSGLRSVAIPGNNPVGVREGNQEV
jgi:hypothetical protein